MIGCFFTETINAANEKLLSLLERLGAVYVDKRAWSKTVRGLSAYFENGLSTDISFMPTEQLPVRSAQLKVLFSKTPDFRQKISEGITALKFLSPEKIFDCSGCHHFIYALRKTEIAILRSEFIYADIELGEARKLLLDLKVICEGKKWHQFKAYNTLDADFLKQLAHTYPLSQTKEDLSTAKDALLSLYIDTVNNCDFAEFDEKQMKLLGCFE